MAVRIGSNGVSLGAQRRLSEATSALSEISQRLSSGLRINTAGDDAAGLQIAEGLRSDSKVYGQAIRNINDGVSLLNIAQGAVQGLSNIVVRQAELSEQAANGTYSPKQRAAMDAEANALVREYNRIIQTTSFNGISTLTGITNALRVQLGYGTNGGIEVGVGNKIGFAAGSGNFGQVLPTAERTNIFFGNGTTPAATESTSFFFLDGGKFTSYGAGDYFTLYDGNDNPYYVWFNVDGTNFDPGAAGTGIQINIGSSDNEANIANAVAFALSGLSATFTTTNYFNGSLSITNASGGFATDAAVVGAGIISVVDSDGADSSVNYVGGDYFTLNDGTTSHYF